MRRTIIFILLILFCSELSAQNNYLRSLDLDTNLNFTIAPYFNKNAKACVMVSSTLLLDTFDSYNRNIYKTHFTKFDSVNNITLDKSFTLVNKSIGIRGTVKLLQGGYIGYGYYYDSKSLQYKTAGVPGCIIRYTENGDTVFTKKFPYRKDNSDIRSFRQLPDSSFVLLSDLRDSNGAHTLLTGLRVMKLNKDFTTAWDKVFYYSDATDPTLPRIMYCLDALVQTTDKGFLIGFGEIIKTADTTYHAVLFEIDSNGKFLWEKKYYGNDDYSSINKIIRLRDGNYLLMGYLYSYFHVDLKVTDFIFVIKVNEQGQVLWKRMIKKYEFQYAMDVDEFPNGNILFAGVIDVRGNTHVIDYKASLICLDKNGKMLWDRQYEVPSNYSYDIIDDVDFSEVEIADDNSILAFGNIFAFDSTFPHNNHWNQDFLFLHADSLGCIMPGTCPITNVETLPQEPNYFYTYPNPTSSTISFKSNLSLTSNIQIKMFNALGQIVLQKSISDFNESIDVSDFAKGIYFVELSADNFVGTQKVVVE